MDRHHEIASVAAAALPVVPILYALIRATVAGGAHDAPSQEGE